MNITYKVALVNNYIVITSDDLPGFLGVQAPAKNIVIKPTIEDVGRFEFWGFDTPTTKWNTLNIDQILDENGDPFTLETWTTFYTTNTGNFSTAGGGSPATEKKGIATVLQPPGEQVVLFNHGLPGANWVQLQYSDPTQGNIYLGEVSIVGSEVQVYNALGIASGSYTIYYHVAIIP
jgi:hypothetical protein